jgi:hypothetical protein
MEMNKIEDFLDATEPLRMKSSYEADDKIKHVATMEIDRLRTVLFNYRFFTATFIDDIATLVARLPFGKLKSIVGSILSEELGDGDHNGAHVVLYDNFLRDIGFPVDSKEECRKLANNEILGMLRGLSADTQRKSVDFALGLRGTGAECVCGVYMSVLEKHLLANPYIQKHLDTIDWKFWEIHAGEADDHHMELIRDAYRTDYADAEPTQIRDLWTGYEMGKKSFDRFWELSHSIESTR